MGKDCLTIVSAQFDPHIFDLKYNVNKTLELIDAAGEDCDLIVFPEAALTGYCFASKEETRQGAIEREGAEIRRLQAIAAERDCSIVIGAVERLGETLYNSVFFLEPDGTLFSYQKSHLPFLGGDRFVEAGNLPAAVFDTRFGKIGLIVCYELRFPETARIAALQGARLILQPTNLPDGGESHPDFLTRARACENRVHFVSCNRCGTERGFHFIGRSQIIDCNGAVLADCGEEETCLKARLDLRDAERKDIISAPGERELYLLRHRRWDLYQMLAQKPDEEGYVSEHCVQS